MENIKKSLCRYVVKNFFYVVCEVLWPLPIKEIKIQACIVVLGITNGSQNFYFFPFLRFLQVEKWRMCPLLIYIYNCQMWSQLWFLCISLQTRFLFLLRYLKLLMHRASLMHKTKNQGMEVSFSIFVNQRKINEKLRFFLKKKKYLVWTHVETDLLVSSSTHF